MKCFNIILLILFFHGYESCAQSGCKSLTFNEVFQALKMIDTNKKRDVMYRKCQSFDFQKFEANDNFVSGKNYFEIGFNKKNEVEEIEYHPSNKECLNYKLLVYDFPEFRLLIVKLQNGGNFVFNATIIVTMKKISKIFPQFEGDKGYNGLLLSSEFYNKGIEHMSEVMLLDGRMKPSRVYKFLHRQLVTGYSTIYQKESPNTPLFDYTYFFFNTPENQSLRINNNTCISDLDVAFDKADFVLTMAPALSSCKSNPLWLSSGARNYKDCYDFPDKPSLIKTPNKK